MTILGTVPRDNVLILLGRYLTRRPKYKDQTFPATSTSSKSHLLIPLAHFPPCVGLTRSASKANLTELSLQSYWRNSLSPTQAALATGFLEFRSFYVPTIHTLSELHVIAVSFPKSSHSITVHTSGPSISLCSVTVIQKSHCNLCSTQSDRSDSWQ